MKKRLINFAIFAVLIIFVLILVYTSNPAGFLTGNIVVTSSFLNESSQDSFIYNSEMNFLFVFVMIIVVLFILVMILKPKKKRKSFNNALNR